MNKPRILFILPLPPPVHGSAVVSRQIKESRAVQGAFDCDFVNLSTSRNMGEVGKYSPLKVLRFADSYVQTFFKLLVHRYDLCYLAITCHGTSFLKDAPFVQLCKLFGRKVVIHQHNKGMADDVDRRPYNWMLPKVYKDAKVILLSWKLFPDIERIVPRRNVVICHNGIPIKPDDYRSRHNPVPRLLFLSNLIESKGAIVLLDALKILSKRGISYICHYVGGESAEIDVRRINDEIESRGLSESVFYLGGQYGEDKDAEFENADIFVFPTFYSNECFPLVLLEAMSYSLPVVTTDEGGIPDIVEDGRNGLICRRRDSESLADSIQKLIEDKHLRENMGRLGRKILEENYSEAIFENRIVECLNECITNSKNDFA